MSALQRRLQLAALMRAQRTGQTVRACERGQFVGIVLSLGLLLDSAVRLWLALFP